MPNNTNNNTYATSIIHRAEKALQGAANQCKTPSYTPVYRMAAALCFENVKEQALQGLPGTDGQGLVGGGALAQNAHLNDENGSGLHMHPIHFLYGHLHNSIRTELDNLSNWVLALEADNEQDLQQRLQHLKERYHFLEQVYKYHSSVEDEVMIRRWLSTLPLE